MKIDLSSPATDLVSKEWASQKSPQTNGLASQGVTEDRVTLTSTKDSAAASLAAHAMNMPQIRQDKVNALRQAISSGSYQLDSSKIAQAISAEESH